MKQMKNQLQLLLQNVLGLRAGGQPPVQACQRCNLPVLGYYRIGSHSLKPEVATPGSACFDIKACLIGQDGELHRLILPAKGHVRVKTGLIFDIPKGYSVRLHGRSGLAAKHGVTLTNGEGIIDSDYVEEVMVLLSNFGDEPIEITHGMRIAQGELVRNCEHRLINLPLQPMQKTTRTGGFGSTGLN